MNKNTHLLRQVHPNFINNGEITSQVFRPTPKDENLLSMYDGDMITPEEAYNHFINNGNCSSEGVLAVSNEECAREDIDVIEDRVPFPEHVSLNFSKFNKKEIERKAKVLKAQAKARGWLYRKP